MKLKFYASQVISCHLRLIYVFIFQQTASILNSLHSTVHCGHGIHYHCRSTFFELKLYCNKKESVSAECAFHNTTIYESLFLWLYEMNFIFFLTVYIN